MLFSILIWKINVNFPWPGFSKRQTHSLLIHCYHALFVLFMLIINDTQTQALGPSHQLSTVHFMYQESLSVSQDGSRGGDVRDHEGRSIRLQGRHLVSGDHSDRACSN